MPRPGAPRKITAEYESQLVEVVRRRPRSLGLPYSMWTLERMADRFHEHPLTVLVLTNMFYSEAPRHYPRSGAMQKKLNWLEIPLEGDTVYEFDEQIGVLQECLWEWWQTKTSETTGNPIYATPSVLVIYRKDRERYLASVTPRRGDLDHSTI